MGCISLTNDKLAICLDFIFHVLIETNGTHRPRMDSKLKKVLHHWDLFGFEEHISVIKKKFVSAKLNEGFLRKMTLKAI